MRRAFTVLMLVIAVFAASAAEPYEKMKIGIMGGLSTAIALKIQDVFAVKDLCIGAQLHVSPLISVRPSVILYGNTAKYTDVLAGDPEFDQRKSFFIGGQIDVPLHFLRFSDGSIYAGPSVFYMNASEKTYALNVTTPYLDYEYSYGIFSIGAIAGGQYQPSRHFGVFLDLGLDYQARTEEYKNYNAAGTTTANEKTANGMIYFRGATIGAILYIN